MLALLPAASFGLGTQHDTHHAHRHRRGRRRPGTTRGRCATTHGAGEGRAPSATGAGDDDWRASTRPPPRPGAAALLAADTGPAGPEHARDAAGIAHAGTAQDRHRQRTGLAYASEATR